ncbi:MAG TPA: GspMb/PilO family protein [Gemmatimonadaceae bacterium]|nr:GspMb/PilO family protein [Gemmatimonadaceae bacterium]
MIALQLTPRDRRILIVGVAVIGGLTVTAKGVPAALAWQRDRVDSAAVFSERLALARASVRQLPALRDSLRARQARVAALDTTLITGASAAAAAGTLASLVEDFASDLDVKANAIQIRADTLSRPGLTRVGVRLIGVCDVAGLAAFLRTIETDARAMSVRDLAVTQPDPAGPDAKPEMLRVDVGVDALALITPKRGAR